MGSESPRFRRSSFCSQGGCLEVAGDDLEQIQVRGTDGANRKPLIFPATSWAAFVNGIKKGDFAART
jgi:uncharacterized protein DUF397